MGITKLCGSIKTYHINYLYHVLKSFNSKEIVIDANNKKYPSINSKLERITIENPRCDNALSIRDVLKNFGEMFKEIGWELTSNGWKKGDIGNPVLNIVKIKGNL